MPQLRHALLHEAEEIHDLLVAASETEPPGRFVVDSLDFVRRHLGSDAEGFCLVVEDAGELIAVMVVRFPGFAEDNLARDLLLSDEIALACAHIESVAVLPSHRGRGLHRELLAAAERRLAEARVPIALATVSPDNTASLSNFRALGYHDAARRQKYGGLDRIILLKQLVDTQDPLDSQPRG